MAVAQPLRPTHVYLSFIAMLMVLLCAALFLVG
jgi:hypothetical protein